MGEELQVASGALLLFTLQPFQVEIRREDLFPSWERTSLISLQFPPGL